MISLSVARSAADHSARHLPLSRSILSQCASAPIRQGFGARDQCADGGGRGLNCSPRSLGQDYLVHDARSGTARPSRHGFELRFMDGIRLKEQGDHGVPRQCSWLAPAEPRGPFAADLTHAFESVANVVTDGSLRVVPARKWSKSAGHAFRHGHQCQHIGQIQFLITSGTDIALYCASQGDKSIVSLQKFRAQTVEAGAACRGIPRPLIKNTFLLGPS